MIVATHGPRGARLDPLLFLVLVLCSCWPVAARADRTAAVNPLGTWREVTILGRDWPAAAYDPTRGRMLVAAGTRAGSGDTWCLSLDDPQAWLRLPGASHLPVGDGASMTYDPPRDRMVVFGGHSDGYMCVSFDGLFALLLAAASGWQAVTVAGTRPPPRYQHAAVYDPVRERLIVVAGGETSGGTTQCETFTHRYNDAWAFPLATGTAWQELPQPPPEVEGPGISAIYDPAADRLVVFAPPRTFALDLGAGAWSELATDGSAPSIRGRAVYDAAHQRGLLFDGHDVWALDLASAAWSKLAPVGSGPSLAGGPALIHDAAHGRLVVFGGNAGVGQYPDETWSLSLGVVPAWSPLVRSPGRTVYRPMVLDPVRDRLVVFGLGGTGTETWTMSLAGPPAWNVLATVGQPPSSRAGHTVVYDSAHDRLLLYGGDDGATFLSDVWSLSLGEPPTWTLVSGPGGPPPRRSFHVAAYDPDGDRMIVFGGLGYEASDNLGTTVLDDAWQLSLGGADPHWLPLVAGGQPPPARVAAAGVYDPIRTRLLISGGYGSLSVPARDDTWALSLAGAVQWTDLNAPIGRPVAEHTMIYDPLRDRAVLFGDLAETWSLDLGDPDPAWSQVFVDPGERPAARIGHGAAYDRDRDRMLLFGGVSYGGPISPWGEVWALAWDMPVPVAISLASAVVAGDRVTLTWQCPDLSVSAMLHRRAAGGDWAALASVRPDGTGRIVYVDRQVAAGRAYDYRLGVRRGEREEFFGAAHAEIPAATGLTILGFRPNPARGEPTLAFSLAAHGAGTLELLDVAGRRVWARSLDALDPGLHQLVLTGAKRLPSGVYIARLVQGAATATRRVTISH